MRGFVVRVLASAFFLAHAGAALAQRTVVTAPLGPIAQPVALPASVLPTGPNPAAALGPVTFSSPEVRLSGPAIGPAPSAPETFSEASLDQFFDARVPKPDASLGAPGALAEAKRYDGPLLDEIQRASFRFFEENADSRTGLVRDRAANFSEIEERPVASMAAVGFGLTALGVGASRGWMSRDEAYARALKTLKHLRDEQPHEHGWFYHFVDMRTGERHAGSEVSSIDTALMLAGAVFIGEYFKGTEVEEAARDIYRRVDFNWMMTDGGRKPDSRTLSMGWTPEKGFIESRWDRYSEHMLLNLLGLGSPGEALPKDSWDAWKRPDGASGEGSGPLFTHQYSHIWFDFRGKRDRYRDYFANSVAATLANRKATLEAKPPYATYGEDSWGLTASDGPEGYRAYGAYPHGTEHDGTVAPTAAGSSIVFTPELSLRALRAMRAKGEPIWGRYGFSDAFNADPKWREQFNAEGLWRSPDALGIDQGALLLMIENHRTGLVWSTFMRAREARRAMSRAGFRRD